MLAQGNQLTQDLMREQQREKEAQEDRIYVKKIKSFHQGRSPNLFPGITMDVNEHEFVELLLDLDQIYDTSHRLNVVLMKYTKSIERKNNTIRILMMIRTCEGEWGAWNSGRKDLPVGSCE
jgi:hypothetical protein